MKTKTEKKILWCVYLDVTLSPQWCMAGSKEAKALSSCPSYIVGYYSKRQDPQAIGDAEATRHELRRLQEAA